MPDTHHRRCALRIAASLLLLTSGALAPAGGHAALPSGEDKVEPRVLDRAAGGAAVPVIVLLNEQADLRLAAGMRDPDARGRYVYKTLKAHAKRTQKALRRFLKAAGVPHRALWGVNAVVLHADRALLEILAARDDVRVIESNLPLRRVEAPQPEEYAAPLTTGGVEWGVNNVGAPQVWALGYSGQGIVIANQDTGMQWDHPAIKGRYRGWNGSTADHNYNWRDAIHSGGGVCGADSPAPCDDHGHGTHTTGTALGDDGGGNQIGVAPGATWIGCRNMDQGVGTPATYLECFQFFLAPTTLAGTNPDPTRRPHVMTNSWACPPSEGCAADTLRTAVENAQAAGIFVVAAAGNSGLNCSTVTDPPAIYGATFSVGAYDSSNVLAGFSSRGPVTVDLSSRRKPDIAAPGVAVRSSVPANTYGVSSGTSMATPHVAGVVALLWSARPELVRDIATTRAILEGTANPAVIVNPAQTCGGITTTAVPNNAFGFGRADAYAAVLAPLPGSTPTATPIPSATGTPTNTRTPSATASSTASATASPSPPPSATPTVTRTPTNSPLPTATASPTASATASTSPPPSATPTATPTPTHSPLPSATASSTASATASASKPPSATPTATPTPTSSPLPSATPTVTATPTIVIAGHVRYYVADRPVPDVDVRLTGPDTLDQRSDLAGGFAFAPLATAPWSLGAAKQADVALAVGALDASYVLQAAVGLRPLTATQMLACDVTGNGALSSFDASWLLQFAVGLAPRFPVADLCGSDWTFVPEPGPASNQSVTQPGIVGGTCRHGSIAYDPLTGSAPAQDFLAVAYGDCTGDWGVPAAPDGGPLAIPSGQIRLGTPRRLRAHTRVPVIVDSEQPFYAVVFEMRYEVDGPASVRVRRSPVISGALLESNAGQPGVVKVALASVGPLQPHTTPVGYVDFFGAHRQFAARLTAASIDDRPALPPQAAASRP